LQTIGQSSGARLQDHGRLDLAHVLALRRGSSVKAGPRHHSLCPEFLAAPGADNQIQPLRDDLLGRHDAILGSAQVSAVGECRCRRRSRRAQRPTRSWRSPDGSHPVHPHQPRDILELLLAYVLETEVELARASSCTRAAKQIPPGWASHAATLTPSPKMSPSRTTNVALVDADAKLYAAGGNAAIASSDLALYFARAAQRIDHAPPHFHVFYQGREAKIDIDNLELMAGQ
jgi:hypothetical protein